MALQSWPESDHSTPFDGIHALEEGVHSSAARIMLGSCAVGGGTLVARDAAVGRFVPVNPGFDLLVSGRCFLRLLGLWRRLGNLRRLRLK